MTVSSTKTTAAARAQDIRRARARKWARRILLWVALPTLLSILYYGLVATEEYESVTIFAVKPETEPTDNAKEVCAKDGALVEDVALSRDVLTTLNSAHRLADHYSTADLWSRLSPTAGQEELYRYLRTKIALSSPSAACTFTLKVKAFSAPHAQLLAADLVRVSSDKMQSLGLTNSRLVLVTGPSRPDLPAYPKRLWGILTVLVVSLTGVGVVSLMAGAVREHAKL